MPSFCMVRSVSISWEEPQEYSITWALYPIQKAGFKPCTYMSRKKQNPSLAKVSSKIFTLSEDKLFFQSSALNLI